MNESDKGTVKATESFKNLLELIKKSKNGFNIVVHVANGRITKSFSDNYNFFVETVMQGKVPVILVQTGCENTEPMSLWVEENKLFYDSHGFKYKSIIASCFAETQIPDFKPRYDRLRNESKESVLFNIEKYALERPLILYKDSNSLMRFVKRLWNGLCEFFEVPTWKASINKSLYELLRRMGFSEEEANEITNQNG